MMKQHLKSFTIAMIFGICTPNLMAQTQISAEQLQLKKDSKTFKAFIPKGYTLFSVTRSDLNKDHIQDAVLIVKATKPQGIVQENGKTYDRNRRGIVVLLGQKATNKYQLLTQNLTAMSSDQENGGVYFPPELIPEIKQGVLHLNYQHGRYGYQVFKFQTVANDMRLIGYDRSENYGPTVQTYISINFLTAKKLVKDNLNKHDVEQPERFKETWSKIQYAPIYLSKVKDFDALNFLD
ncbi:hypothetical protein A3K93_09430 [Acinetobacter sp. NCu2D-2]|uniref:hypothetical protein n=1 Tax=Acinetobacter sp. NCu2D-2 TaxID=1608473 RepID=UPI0007CDB632|nr:hypothetical protein [Acinetobacter sp. NCu2D-2]ANF82394.1 hypothetical protein A3K93_09430 [Acinetobacter sp. NCu2D-2]